MYKPTKAISNAISMLPHFINRKVSYESGIAETYLTTHVDLSNPKRIVVRVLFFGHHVETWFDTKKATNYKTVNRVSDSLIQKIKQYGTGWKPGDIIS